MTNAEVPNTNVEDMISRQAAIDALVKRTHLDWEYLKIINPFLGVLEQLPSAQPEQIARDIATILENERDMRVMLKNAEQRWIPCSERLPIGQEEVIVSCHDDSGDTPFDYTSCGWVTTDGEYWIVDNEINNHVIAWMPLPKPYKGGGKTMRLIDTDKIGLTDFEIVMCESSYENALSILLNKIFNAPTVDAIPVIRCKDCIHKPKDHNYCWSFEKFVVDDFFCAEGERRKE